MNSVLKIKNRPPREKGQVTIAVAENGHVAFLCDGGDILFTPEQARNVARLLEEKADIIDQNKRRVC